MVQEVQQKGNWYQTPNRIEWVWFSERGLNDYTQIRNKKLSVDTFKSWNLTFDMNSWEVFATSWTYTSSNGRTYKTDSGIYMALWGAYQIEYIPTVPTYWSYEFSLRIYVDGKKVFDEKQHLDTEIHWILPINLGKKNKITASFEWYSGYPLTMPITLRFTQL